MLDSLDGVLGQANKQGCVNAAALGDEIRDCQSRLPGRE